MAKLYKKHSRGGSFRNQNFGDLGLRSFQDQQKQITDSLKLQQARSKEYGDDYISNLKGVHRSEEENRSLISKLENEAYQNRRKAISTRSDREVSYLNSQAEEARKKSDFWLDFSTTHSKGYAELAGKLVEFGQQRNAVKWWKNQLTKSSSELNKFTDF